MSNTYTIKVKPLDGAAFHLFVTVFLKGKWWQGDTYITGFTVPRDCSEDEIKNRVLDHISLNKQFEIIV